MQNNESIELSVVMPCLNEAETLAVCIKKARGAMQECGIVGEVVIADNGSSDGSQNIAVENGARVVHVTEKGYGNALMGGINGADGKYIIMGDADDSYDFSNLKPFVAKLREGYDLVMGNRFKGGIAPGAMPPLHKYLGNPVLTAIGRILFKCPSRDFHCGLRGFSKDAFTRMRLKTTGMEFASEIVIKATLQKMKIIEVPTTLKPDGRNRPPHLRSWRDGWRHLRFMLLFNPNWLFLYPGIILFAISLPAAGILTITPITIGNINFDIHSLLFAVLGMIIGYQSILCGVFAKLYSRTIGLVEKPNLAPAKYPMELGLIFGLLLLAAGILGALFCVYFWGVRHSFGQLDPVKTMRFAIPVAGLLVMGIQTILGSFLNGVITLAHKE